MDAVINGIPLMVVILGLVEFAKQLGVTGKASLVLSVVLGAAFGIAYQLSIAVPVAFADWFAAIVTGLAWGLAASGLYDLGKRYLTNAG